MRKYRVTEKHGFYKPGIEFIQISSKQIEFLNNGWIVNELGMRVLCWITDGWIEEIKEVTYNTAWVEKMKLMDDILSKHHIEDLETLKKILEHEFTKEDMISFARGCNKIFESFNVVKFDDELEKYKQERTLRNLANIQRDGL